MTQTADGPRVLLVLFLCVSLAVGTPVCAQVPATAMPRMINLIVVEGEGAINNIKQRTAREAIVQVEDENHRPIAGAAVTFTLPGNGASGSFLNGARTLSVVSDNQGRAVARGLRPNNVQGQMQVRVTANFSGLSATTVITMTNVLSAAAAATAGGISVKLITILAVAGAAAAAGGAYAATRGGGSTGPANTPGTVTPTGPAAIVITPGTPTAGGPR